MRFFIDNNLPPRLSKALHALLVPEHECVHLTDKFPRNASDVEWLSALAEERDWVIVCGDFRILRNKAERKVWQKTRITSFFLRRGWVRSKSLNLFELAGRLIIRWPELIDKASTCERGTAFEVPLSGKIIRLS